MKHFLRSTAIGLDTLQIGFTPRVCLSLGFPALFPCGCCWRWWCVGSQEFAEDECLEDEEEDARAPDLHEDGFAEHLEADRLREPDGLEWA